MLGVIAREGLLDDEFVAGHTEGIDAALATAAEWPPERAAAVTGVDAAAIVAAARRFGAAERATALWSMGANQSTVGTLKNRAIINLCLATGNVGRPGTGPFSLTGQPNAMGGREVGGLAQLLPGYRSVASAADRAEMRRLWDAPGVPDRPGIAATELTEALESGAVRAVWIAGTNPVVSQPDARRFAAALRGTELVVVQDAYHPTETSALAHFVLPAAQWPEKDGTMTSSERRVTLVRKAVEPPGDALPDWQIFARLAGTLGHGEAFAWPDAAAVHAEYVRTTAGRLCDQSDFSHARLDREGPLQWGGARLYDAHRFPTPSGRARFAATPHIDPADAPDADFPLILTTGRVASHWHTLTRTGHSPNLVDRDPQPFVELHPSDAKTAGIRSGERVRLTSRRAEAIVVARITSDIPAGTCFAPFHWGALHSEPAAGSIGALTVSALDPTSKQPELKACAVRVESLTPATTCNAGVRPPRCTWLHAQTIACSSSAPGWRRRRRWRRCSRTGRRASRSRWWGTSRRCRTTGCSFRRCWPAGATRRR